MGVPFVFRYGEPVVVDLVVEAAEGSVPADYTVAMTMKLHVPGEIGVPMVVTYFPAVGADLAFWRGRLHPVRRVGRHLVEAQLSRLGIVEIVPDAKTVDVLAQVLV